MHCHDHWSTADATKDDDDEQQVFLSAGTDPVLSANDTIRWHLIRTCDHLPNSCLHQTRVDTNGKGRGEG